jgi:hypothetical protein
MAPLTWVCIWRSSCFNAGPDAAEVDRVHSVESFGWLVGGVAGWDLDAGIGERHIQPAEGGDSAVDHSGYLFFGGDVAGNAEELVAHASQVLGSGEERACVDVAEHDDDAGRREGLSGGQPHAGAGAGVKGDLPSEVVVGVHRGFTGGLCDSREPRPILSNARHKETSPSTPRRLA